MTLAIQLRRLGFGAVLLTAALAPAGAGTLKALYRLTDTGKSP